MISTKEIEMIKSNIIENYHPDKIILFGSYACGNPTEDSDLDLAILKSTIKSKFREILEIRKNLRNFHVNKDILIFSNYEFNDFKNIAGTIQYNINLEGIILYEKKSNYSS